MTDETEPTLPPQQPKGGRVMRYNACAYELLSEAATRIRERGDEEERCDECGAGADDEHDRACSPYLGDDGKVYLREATS